MLGSLIPVSGMAVVHDVRMFRFSFHIVMVSQEEGALVTKQQSKNVVCFPNAKKQGVKFCV